MGGQHRGSVVSMVCLIGFLMIWHPKKVWKFDGQETEEQAEACPRRDQADLLAKEITQAWIPWVVLSVIVFVWGTQTGKLWMNTPEKVFPSTASWPTKPSQITNPKFPMNGSAQLGRARPSPWCRSQPRKPRSTA